MVFGTGIKIERQFKRGKKDESRYCNDFQRSDPDWIRTNDPQLRRLMLYPAELQDLVSEAP